MNDGEAAKIFEDYKFNLEKVKLRIESKEKKENTDQKKKDEDNKPDLEKAKKDEKKEIDIEKAKKVEEIDIEEAKKVEEIDTEMKINMGIEKEAENSSVVDRRDDVDNEAYPLQMSIGNEEKGTQNKILKRKQNLVAVHDKKVKKEEEVVKVEKKEEGADKVEKKEEAEKVEKKEEAKKLEKMKEMAEKVEKKEERAGKMEKEKQSDECQEVKGPEGDQDAAMLEILKKIKPGKNSNVVKKKKKRESRKAVDEKDAGKEMKADLKGVEAE